MNLLHNRIYSLSFNIFNNYSWFYFYIFNIDNNLEKLLSKYNFKITFLNNFLNKKGKLYLCYNNSKIESFCLPKLTYSLHINNNDLLSNLIFYNNIYTNQYYKSNIKTSLIKNILFLKSNKIFFINSYVYKLFNYYNIFFLFKLIILSSNLMNKKKQLFDIYEYL